MTPNEVITDIQMSLCSRLFDYGFKYSSRFKSGSFLLTKRTVNGLVTVVLERKGFINGGNGNDWIQTYLSNSVAMSSPPLISFIPSKVSCDGN
tara:strand:+ start:111 stop:389 length:279 start_codon:yes stop_codon:yes gene_type:complete